MENHDRRYIALLRGAPQNMNIAAVECSTCPNTPLERLEIPNLPGLIQLGKQEISYTDQPIDGLVDIFSITNINKSSPSLQKRRSNHSVRNISTIKKFYPTFSITDIATFGFLFLCITSALGVTPRLISQIGLATLLVLPLIIICVLLLT